MGICYSQVQEWEYYSKSNYRRQCRKRNINKNSIIYEQKSIYETSFASKIQSSFQQQQIEYYTNDEGSILIGSLISMNEKDLASLHKQLSKIHQKQKLHNENEPIILSNIVGKKFLHTHKIKIPQCNKQNQVSCCPNDSQHIIQYDIWKLVSAQNQLEKDKFYIYHPFTQRFLNLIKGFVVCSEFKKQWEIISIGKRRNHGFIIIKCQMGQLCMSNNSSLLVKHRKLKICTQKNHASHLWEINFAD